MDKTQLVESVNHIPSSVHPPEIEMWFDELHGLPGNPLIVDFGTGHGKSAAALGLACPQGRVITFDPGLPYINSGCSPKQYEEETRKFITDSGATNVTFSRESSLEKLWNEPIDVLNIDSDHTYETSKAEIERWVPFLKQGGYLFLHDWDHPRCPGVRQAFEELVPSKFNLEFVKATRAGEIQCAFFVKK